MSRWIGALILLALARGVAYAQADPIQVRTTGSAPAATAQKTALPKDGIAARVNNEVVTWKDVDDSLKTLKKTDLTDELRVSKLRKIAEERLFLQAAKQNSLSVGEPELDEYVRREIKRYGSDEEFERALRVNNITKTEYRENMRKDVLVNKLYRHLIQKAFTNPDDKSPGLLMDTVAPEELRKYYDDHLEEFKAVENVSVWRMGLQYGTDREKAVRVRQAEAFLRKLDQGTDFYFAAAYTSTVPPMTDGEKGQVYGHRNLTREQAAQFYAPETVTYLFETLKEDEVSPIRDEGRTINIFKLVQKVNQKKEVFEDAQFRIRSILENQKREENRRVLRGHLMKNAYVWPADLFDAPR